MKKFKLTFQKGILFCLVLLMIFSVTSCKKHEDTPKDDVKITLESDKYTLQKTDVAKLTVTVTGSTDTTYSWMYDTSLLNIDANNQLKVIGDYSTKRTVEIKAVANADKTKSATISITLNVTPIKPPVKDDISVGIKGSSEVKSGKTINLEAVVTGSDNQTVLWEVKSGSEFATIDSEGRLTASKVSGDKVIEVTVTSLADTSVVATKVSTAPPPSSVKHLRKLSQVVSLPKVLARLSRSPPSDRRDSPEVPSCTATFLPARSAEDLMSLPSLTMMTCVLS